MDQEDAFIDKCAEGFVLGYFNQGEVCTCPSRALIQEDIYGSSISKFPISPVEPATRLIFLVVVTSNTYL